LYAYLPKKNRGGLAADLGAGTGILSLLALTGGRANKVYAIEFQSDFAELCQKNASENQLSDRLYPICKDIRELTDADLEGQKCDLVFTNPPYLKAECGMHNAATEMDQARREICGTIDDFCAAAGRILRFGGAFFCVYRPDRLSDLFSAMKRAKIEPKRLTWIYPDRESAPCLLLCEGRLGGASGLFVTKPLFLYESKGENPVRQTAVLASIYEKGEFDESYRRP
jgi:tRNA1(Val) A37 N6-methylase TrmN6